MVTFQLHTCLVQMDFRSLPAKLSDISSPSFAKTLPGQNVLSPGGRRVSLDRASPRNSLTDVMLDRDYNFVEQPQPNFFCLVTLDFLVDLHEITCCGN